MCRDGGRFLPPEFASLYFGLSVTVGRPVQSLHPVLAGIPSAGVFLPRETTHDVSDPHGLARRPRRHLHTSIEQMEAPVRLILGSGIEGVVRVTPASYVG